TGGPSSRDRTLATADCQVAADAVRAPVGEVGTADRAIGVTTGRTGHRVGRAPGGLPNPWGGGTSGKGPEAPSPASAGASAASETDDSAQGNGLSGLRRRVESFRRRCLRDPGVCSRPLPRDPTGAAEARLHALRQDCASGSAQPPDCTGSGGTRLAGARAGIEILRPSCATNTPTAMEGWSCVRDEGGPL